MLDSLKKDGQPKNQAFLARTAQLEANPGTPKNTGLRNNRFRDRAHIMKSSPTHIIRVLIADDHPVVREGLSAILRSEKDIKIVAEATDGEEACKRYQPEG